MVSISGTGATPTVSFSGVASGIDTEAIINALVDVSARPISFLEREKTNLKSAQAVWSDLDSKVDELESKLRPLKYQHKLLANSTSVSDENVLTVNASGSATQGSYAVTVDRLARAGSEASQTYADSDTLTVGTGTLSVTVGTTTVNVTIDSSNNTLDGIAAAINDSDADVTATVVATDSGGPYRLVVSGNETGDDSAVSLDASGLSGGDQALSFTTLQDAQDAQVTVNGLSVERSSNTITDLVPGLTLSLVSEGSSTTVTVSLDVDAVKSTLEEFVTAYNDVLDVIGQQLSFDADSGADAPPLLGDFSLRGMQRQFQSILTSTVDPGDGSSIALSGLGIRTGDDGRLSIDTADFQDAIDEIGVENVSAFFTTATDGFAAQMQGVLDRVTDPVDGTIATREDAIKTKLGNLDDRIEYQQDRLEAYETFLRKKFSRFETLMGQLQAQSNYLNFQLLQNQQS